MSESPRQTVVGPEQTGRIDRVVQAMTGLSRSRVQALFDNGCVTWNQEPCVNVAHRVVEGDQVALNYDPQRRYRSPRKAWSDRTFSIVFEDSELLVVNKSARVLTVTQDHGLDRNTLEERVGLYLKSQQRQKPILVHRMDRGMSGLMVIAKTPPAARGLQSQFFQHAAKQVYTAIVLGTDLPRNGEIQSRVAVGNNLDQYSTDSETEGELSTTLFQTLQVLPYATLLTAETQPGQPSHIRLHFSERGNPVLGDQRYTRKHTNRMRRQEKAEFAEELELAGWKKNFLAMHCSQLAFEHPQTGKAVSFESPLPKAMGLYLRGRK